ncbi:hypothetical protein IWX76_002600 [Pedobacter sp. CAN_A7]|uniref:exo-alpha-sialidase n=1 Tax=Pedobacter sp. CAN_A7 TaxID=2787722 RepID=UPI0018CA53EF
MSNYKLLMVFLVAIGLGACKQPSAPPMEALAVNKMGSHAVGAYFTKDHKGNPVLCWSEKEDAEALFQLKYAVYDSTAQSFSAPVTVAGSLGCSAGAESMAKIAFKADGTVFALYGKRFEQEKSPFAGAIYYTVSNDAGKTWAKETFLHTDTAHHYGRGFFDVATLADGELAAIWLDGRFGKTIKGSTLFYARTETGKGFVQERILDKGTCECCRTSIIKDDGGNLHVAYRSIISSSLITKKRVRDMAYLYSADQGKTFAPVKTISNDNWEIDGCPHSGPSLASTPEKVHAFWYTAGGTPGLYYTQAGPGGVFPKRRLISATGKHPQMVSLSGNRLALIYEDAVQEEPNAEHASMSKSSSPMHHQAAGMAKIMLQVRGTGASAAAIAVTDGQFADHHAVLTPYGDQLLMAWIREDGHGGSKVYYTRQL